MRAFAHWIIALFASPAGVFVLAALDSTLFFSLPFGIDAAVIILAARLRGLWWIVPLLATAGSVAGAALTFWMGVKIGEQRARTLGAAQAAGPRPRRGYSESGAIALAVLDLIPPPFPFTPFVLAAGALEVKRADVLRHADRLPPAPLRPRGGARRRRTAAASCPGSTPISFTTSSCSSSWSRSR